MASRKPRIEQKKIFNSETTAKDVARVVADGRAWQKLPLPRFSTAIAAAEVSRLLVLLNGAEVGAAGKTWRCRARQILSMSKSNNKEERALVQGSWSLLFSLGGILCLCRLELPSSVREKMESMSAPCRLEELPSSVVLGLLSLALSDLLQEIFLVPCRLVEHDIAAARKVCGKEEVALELEVFPKAQGEVEEASHDLIHSVMHLQIFLAASDLGAMAGVLRVGGWRREYPLRLHVDWRMEAGGTSVSVEEFRALREGDVLLLS